MATLPEQLAIDECPLCDPVEAGFAALPLLCPECLARCRQVLRGQRRETLYRELASLPRPRETARRLDASVAGLEAVKRGLAVAVYNHGKRLALRDFGETECLPGRSHLLLRGAPGTGKTLVVESLAAQLSVPFARIDATTLTPPDRAGSGLEEIGWRLLESSGGDPDRAGRGVVFIDAIDRLWTNPEGSAVLHDLAGLLEGRPLRLPLPAGGSLELPTRDLLFIAAGRIATATRHRAAGFVTDGGGMPAPGVREPQLPGRFAVQLELPAPGVDELRGVLMHPVSGPLARFRRLFGMDGLGLEITEAAVTALVDTAIDEGLGARALHRRLEALLQPAMHVAPACPWLDCIWLDCAGDELFVSLSEPLAMAG